MKIKLTLYKAIVIYTYLLVVIVILLYEYPGLVKYNHNHKKEIEKNNYKQYIAGGYLDDTDMFPLDNMYFPVAISGNINDNLYYYDTYGSERTYGGDRTHEGCDIMTHNNIRGEFPVVAVCDGIIENVGWLELGGYRIGIRSQSGVYYYYAHLYNYEEGIIEGATIQAGQVIGYIGDTGYSKVEGTTGNFDVHLHFGIYLTDDKGCEYTVNPYYMLKKLEKYVINYSFKNQ